MKKRRVISALAAVFLMAFLAVLIFFSRMPQNDLDIVAVNEVLQSTAQAWETLEKGDTRVLSELKPPFAYTVVDRSGNPLYTTDPNIAQSINAGITHRDTLVDVMVQDKVVGKIIIDNVIRAAQEHEQKQLFFILVCAFTLQFLTAILYIFYLDHVVFNPFLKLKKFATHVAGGDLEKPLDMDRSNAFGAFTESFDLMRDALKTARENEWAANQSKKELVAKLSHDIKTPVASIKAVSELMAVSAVSKKDQNKLAIISAKADQIDQLISDLFHATLEELEQLEVKPEEHESHGLLKMLNASDYHNRATIAAIPECLLVFDPLRLQQVFDNVISNSYKYADTALHITFLCTETYFDIAIKDLGKGVLPTELPALCEKFYRGKNAKGKSGAGLGLYISRYFMEQMNGTMGFECDKDTFTVKISILIAGK
ncbi:MAG: HAMP domain-containing sensor histidine kinase [Eubacterium sp.]